MARPAKYSSSSERKRSASSLITRCVALIASVFSSKMTCWTELSRVVSCRMMRCAAEDFGDDRIGVVAQTGQLGIDLGAGGQKELPFGLRVHGRAVDRRRAGRRQAGPIEYQRTDADTRRGRQPVEYLGHS